MTSAAKATTPRAPKAKPASKRTVDEKADEANPLVAEASKPKLPDGCPGLWPFYALPRRVRGKAILAFSTAYSSFSEYEDLEDLESMTDEEQLGLTAKLYDALAAIEDALSYAAADEEAWKDFCANCSDEELVQAFAWYADTFSPGEAEGS